MNIKERIHYFIQNVLDRINKRSTRQIQIKESLTYNENVLKNRILYRGQPKELTQLFNSLGDSFKNSFWGKTKNFKRIQPLTFNLPKLATDKLAELVSDSYNSIKINNVELNKIWEDIEKDIDIKTLINDITTDLCIDGQVGLYINFENGKPYFCYKSGDEIDITYRFNKFYSAKVFDVFYKDGIEDENETKGIRYILETKYGRGYVDYNLYDDKGNNVPLSTLEETKDLRKIEFIKEIDKNKNEVIDTNICLFVPLMIKKSRLFKNKGMSIFDGKESAFSSLDEVWTQWWAAMRKSGPQAYIPADLIPKGANGQPLVPDGYENDWINCGTKSANGDKHPSQIQVVNPSFNAGDYEITFRNALQTACSGLISPSSIGINAQLISSQANTSYNSQIEKTTMNTRASIITCLSKSLNDLVYSTLYAIQSLNGVVITHDFEVSCDFSEFESPSFDEVSATCNSCVISGTMSKYTAIKRMNPTWSEEEVQEELTRIQEDKTMVDTTGFGFGDINEPMIEVDENGGFNEDNKEEELEEVV